MPRVSTYTAADATLDAQVYSVQNNNSRRSTLTAHAQQAPASNAEVRDGDETNKVVTPAGLESRIKTFENDSSHLWQNWGTLTISENQVYGTVLITGLATGSSTLSGGTPFNPSTLPASVSSTVYGDAALIYNDGMTGAAPGTPSASDRWETGFLFRRGTDLYMMVRWRFAGVKLYTSPATGTVSWSDISANSNTLVHNGRGLVAGTGWFLTAPGALEMPLVGDEDDFAPGGNAIPYAIKRVGDTVYALGLGYEEQQNRTYRVGTATRRQSGVGGGGSGNSVTTVSSAAELPSSPTLGDIILVTTAFSHSGASFSANAFYRWGGTLWHEVLLGGGGGSSHPYIVTGNQAASDDWRVGDWVHNQSTSNSTISRGTDTNNILLPNSLNRITAFGANNLSFATVQIRGDSIVGQRTININKLSPGSATDGQAPRVRTLSGTKQVVYEDDAKVKAVDTTSALPSNPVVGDIIFITTTSVTGFERGRFYVRGGSGWNIVSRPLNANDLQSGTVPLARIPNLPASRTTSGTFSADRIPTLAIGTKTSGTLPASRVGDLSASKITSGTFALARIPVLDSSKLPSDIAAGVPETNDPNGLWHSVGVYSYNPGADNTPSTFEGGFLFSHHNAQNALQMDGKEYHRQRNVDIAGQAAPVNLRSNTTFTRITDMSFNLNNIDTDAEYGFYTWDKNNADNTGNTAGTDRPVNSPSYASGTFLAQDGVALAECRETYQIVKSGRSELNDPGDLYYRLKNTGVWGSWSAIDFQQPYTGTPDLQLPSVLPILKARGLKVATQLRQIHQPASGDGDIYLLIPPGNLAHHPAILSQTLTTASRAPIFVQWAWVSDVLQLRVYYTYGSDLIGNAAVAEGRRQSVSYTRTATTWAITNDTVTGGSYSSSNGTVTLTQQYGSGLSITGLPYVTSS